MEHKNITLSLPTDLLTRIEQIAARRGISVSHLLEQALAAIARQEKAEYDAAKKRQLRLMEHGFDYEVLGKDDRTRDDLHVR